MSPYPLRIHAAIETAEMDPRIFERTRNEVQERGELRKDERFVLGVKDLEVLDELFNLGRSRCRR